MKDFIKLVTIDREFYFVGQKEDLWNILENAKGIDLKSIGDNEIKLFPNVSWGTMMMTGGIGKVEGINVRATITDTGSGRLKVNFRTKVRREHYFIILMFAISLFAIIFSDESKWFILYVLGLWIVFHSWFQFIYRFQENHLIDKAIEKLRLTKI